MSISFHLFQLQKIDSQIDLNTKKIKEIEIFISNDQSVIQCENELGEVENKCKLVTSEIQKVDEEIKQKKVKIEQSEASLYGGKVVIPKELLTLQEEIRLHKSHIIELEEFILNKMDELEKRELEKNSAEMRLNQAKINSNASFIEKNNEKKKLEKENEHLHIERSVMCQQIEPAMLKTYEEIRIKKNGVAVSNAFDQTCGSCGSELTPAEWQAARTATQLLLCRSCGRILYSQ